MDFSPTVPGMLHDLARRYGPSIQIAQGDTRLTFEEVDRRSAELARNLVAVGIGKGTRVGLLMPNGPAWAVAFFAITRVGAWAVLLSTFAKAPELAYMLRHSDIDTLLAAPSFLSNDYVQRLREALPSLEGQDGDAPLKVMEAPYLRSVWFIGGRSDARYARSTHQRLGESTARAGVSESLLRELEQEVAPADPALTIYTSGSTSRPKAVVHRHGVVVRHAYALGGYSNFSPGDRLMTTMPFFWVGGLAAAMLAANAQGAAVFCPETPSAEDMLATIRQDRISHIALWPAQISMLRQSPGFQPDDFANIGPMTSEQMAMFSGTAPDRNPGALGMTETFGAHSAEPRLQELPLGKGGAFGRPFPGVERKIVDPDTGVDLPPDQIGELVVRGYSLLEGFYKRERPEVFDADGYYHTGDLCSICEDGFLFFHGRTVETIKSAGANISPREVELAMLQVAGVAEAAVLGMPDEHLGQIVVAAVSRRAGSTITPDELTASLRETLASYKIPKRIEFLATEDFPRTDSNKISKPLLRARFLEARLVADS